MGNSCFKDSSESSTVTQDRAQDQGQELPSIEAQTAKSEEHWGDSKDDPPLKSNLALGKLESAVVKDEPAVTDESSLVNNGTYFIYNKQFYHAKLVVNMDTFQFNNGYVIDLQEDDANPKQLWMLQEDERHSGYFYIVNLGQNGRASLTDIRVPVPMPAFLGCLLAYDPHYDDSQMWKFIKKGDYYQICSFIQPDKILNGVNRNEIPLGICRIKATEASSTDDSTQWKFIPRFKAHASEAELFPAIDNRQGTEPITKEVTITTGIKLTNSQTVTTKQGFESSLKASLGVKVDGITAGMESTATMSSEVTKSLTNSEEKSWSRTESTTFTIPPGKKYRVVQTLVNFTSELSADNCALYGDQRVEESGTSDAATTETWVVVPGVIK